MTVAASIALASVAFVAGIAEAKAVELQSKGFVLPLDTPGTTTCVLLPRDDGPGCAGLDVDRLRNGLVSAGSPVVGAAVERFDGWQFGVVLLYRDDPQYSMISSESLTEGTKGSADGARKMLPGAEVQVHGIRNLGASFDLISLRDQPAARWVVEAHRGEALLIIESYVVPSDAGHLGVQFFTDGTHASDVYGRADAMMARITRPAAHLSLFGLPQATLDGFRAEYDAAYRRARLLTFAAVGGGIVVVVVVLLVRRRRAALRRELDVLAGPDDVE
jgi:hypothetical protein